MAKKSKAPSPVSEKVYVTFTALVSSEQYDHENTVSLELEFPENYLEVIPLTQMAKDTMPKAIQDYGKRMTALDPDALAAQGELEADEMAADAEEAGGRMIALGHAQ